MAYGRANSPCGLWLCQIDPNGSGVKVEMHGVTTPIFRNRYRPVRALYFALSELEEASHPFVQKTTLV
jgi:hypothetical protein